MPNPNRQIPRRARIDTISCHDSHKQDASALGYDGFDPCWPRLLHSTAVKYIGIQAKPTPSLPHASAANPYDPYLKDKYKTVLHAQNPRYYAGRGLIKKRETDRGSPRLKNTTTDRLVNQLRQRSRACMFSSSSDSQQAVLYVPPLPVEEAAAINSSDTTLSTLLPGNDEVCGDQGHNEGTRKNRERSDNGTAAAPGSTSPK